MIVCLFVVCIEYMQNRHETAVKQALNGFCLVEGLTKCDGDSRGISLPHIIEGELVQRSIEWRRRSCLSAILAAQKVTFD